MTLTDQEARDLVFGQEGNSLTPQQFAGFEPIADENSRLAGFPALQPSQDSLSQFSQEFRPDRGIISSIGDFIGDQLDPLNLALLAASFTIPGRIAKAIPLLVETGTALKTAGVAGETALLTSRSFFGNFLRTATINAGGLAPFAVAELIEEPEPGETRLGSFARELLVLEAIDLATFTPISALFKIGSRGLRAATKATFESSFLRHAAANPLMAKADIADRAFAEILREKIKLGEKVLGKEATEALLESAKNLANAPPSQLNALLTKSLTEIGSNPEAIASLKKLGVPPSALEDTLLFLRDGFEESIAAAKVQASTENVAARGRDFVAGEAFFDRFIKGPKTVEQKFTGLINSVATKKKIPLSQVQSADLAALGNSIKDEEQKRLFKLFVTDRFDQRQLLPVLADSISGRAAEPGAEVLARLAIDERAAVERLAIADRDKLIKASSRTLSVERGADLPKQIKALQPEIFETQRLKFSRDTIRRSILTDNPIKLSEFENRIIRSLTPDELNDLIIETRVLSLNIKDVPPPPIIEETLRKIFSEGPFR